MKKPWHKPKIQLLDARATAQSDVGTADRFLFDPNHNGDVGDGSETGTLFGANHHKSADTAS